METESPRLSSDRGQTHAILTSTRIFKYQALEHPTDIRLLQIVPGSGGDEVHCSIVHVSLASKPAYEALSYTWGDGQLSCSIHIDGICVGITTNLLRALYRVRDSSLTRVLWVDAICINQSDVPERNSQVRMMRHIYAQALQVLIWLGEEEPTDSMAFGLISEFQEETALAKRHPSAEWDNQSHAFEFAKQVSVDGKMLARAVANLLKRTWFRRVWIIQEVVVAAKATLICGSQTTDWATFSRMIRYVQRHGLETVFGATIYVLSTISVMAWVRSFRAGNAEFYPNILLLLEKTQLCSSTDPRDRIFALLGISSDADAAIVTADYSKTCEDVYIQLAINGLRKKNLSCLSFCRKAVIETSLNLPSWVPDWSANTNPSPISPLFGLGFTASGASTANISISSDHKILSLTGFKVDVIEQVTLGANTFESAEPFYDPELEVIRELYKSKASTSECEDVASASDPYPTGEDFVDVFWRTMMCNRLASGKKPSPELGKAVGIYRYMFEHIDDIAAKRYENLDPSIMQNFGENMQIGLAVGKWASGRVFCRTKNRLIGWVSRGTNPGDLVWLLKGGEVPYVLKHNAEGHYRLLGDCYIHGIMEGQAMARGNLVEEMINIC